MIITLDLLYDITAALLAFFVGLAFLAYFSGEVSKKNKPGVLHNIINIVYEISRRLFILTEILLMVMMFTLAFAAAANIYIRWRLGWI